jgi:hypothetical protein
MLENRRRGHLLRGPLFDHSLCPKPRRQPPQERREPGLLGPYLLRNTLISALRTWGVILPAKF